MYNVKQDLSLFDNVVTKVVGTSPFNIDGNKIYQIKCDEYTWKEKLSNGRHWQVNWGKTSNLTVKDVNLNVKEQLCARMISVLCSKCTILLMKLHFHGVLWRDPTSVQNAYEWNRDTKLLTIWHQGKHICLLKKAPVEKDDAMKMANMLKNVMQLHPHATKTQIMDLGSEYHLVHGENWLSNLFVQICMKNKSIYEQALRKVRQETVGHNWSSINAVVKLKRGNPTFVMKTSKLSAKTALHMDTCNKKTPLTECVVFMDGLHSRVKDYITLTLWVKNPIICKTQRLASMECASEDMENITIFLQNSLDILCEVKNDPNYVWKP